MVKPFSYIPTVNTRIRMSTPDDAPFVTAIENDADLKQLLGGPSGKSEEFYRKFLSASTDLRFLIVESLASGFPIGLCGLLTGLLSDDCEVRVILTKNYSGRGLGTEVATALKKLAADIFPSKVLTAKAHPDNEPSLAIISKLGLVPDGTVTSDSHDNGWLNFRAPLATAPSNQTMQPTAGRSDA
jgi:RimJ/RimL family protein N-acetyltransferase